MGDDLELGGYVETVNMGRLIRIICGAVMTVDDGRRFVCNNHSGHLGMHGMDGHGFGPDDETLAKWRAEGPWGTHARK